MNMKKFESNILGRSESSDDRCLFTKALHGLAWTCLLWTHLICGAEPLFAASQVYQLKFQKQMPLEKEQDLFTYTIQKGEYVYAILRRFDVPEHRLEETLKRVKRLNPHLNDLGRVKPGDSLHLPDSLLEQETGQGESLEAGMDIPAYTGLEYTVKPGDTVFAILKQHSDLPDKLGRTLALKTFQELNPGLKNIDRIVPGQQIQIPQAQNREAAGAARGTQPAAPEREESIQDRSRQQKPRRTTPPAIKTMSGEKIVRSLLEFFGFRFVSGSDLLLPSGEDNWVRINLEQMELARTHWGESVLFVPGSLREERDQEAFAAAGLKTCLVPKSWDMKEVFQALEAVLRPRFIAWTAQQSLIQPFQETILELRSNHLVAIRRQGELRFYLVLPDSAKNSLPSGLVIGFLAAKGVRLLVPASASSSELAWEVPAFPDRESLLIPRLPKSGFVAALKSSFSAESLRLPEPGRDFESFFAGLQTRGKAGRELLAVTLHASDVGDIKVRVPVIRLQLSPGEVFLLEEKHSDPYLVALLNLQGYAAYLLTG